MSVWTLAAAVLLAAGPTSAPRAILDQPLGPNAISMSTGGITSFPTETRIDLDRGTLVFGAGHLGADTSITTVTESAIAPAMLERLRALAGALAPDEVLRDTCPSPDGPKPPIADSITWVRVVVDGRRQGGIIQANACSTPRVVALRAAISCLTYPDLCRTKP